jgi:hypothetical protein
MIVEEDQESRYVVHPASYSMDTESTAAGVKLATHPIFAKAMNEWSYTSIPPHALWRAQGPFTYTCRPITVDNIIESVSA